MLCDTVGIVGGGTVAYFQLGVEPRLYYESAREALEATAELIPLPKDVYTGLFKAWIYGITIGVISCAAGLRATGRGDRGRQRDAAGGARLDHP